MFNAAVLAWSGASLSGWMLRVVFGTTVVLAAAWLAAALLRRSSAAARHRAWSLAVLAALLLPVLALCVPEWRLGWLAPPAEPAQAERLVLSPESRRAVESMPPAEVAASPGRRWPANDVADSGELAVVPVGRIATPSDE